MAQRRFLGLTVGVAILAVLAGASYLASAPAGRASQGSSTQRHVDPRPDIVLVLMDDASYELLATMTQARRMQAQGATYENAHVVDSLCCPSRASIFTGRPPHQTGVLTNTSDDPADPIGGYAAFVAHHNAHQTFNLALQRSGYTTGFVGKYLNGYDLSREHGVRRPPPSVPGWTHFDAILGGGYPEWGFWSARRDDGGPVTLHHETKPPRDSTIAELDRHYATNVESDDAVSFVDRHRDDSRPYFLEVATYAPHAQMQRAYSDNPPFPSAFVDRAPKGDPLGGNCGARLCADLSLRDLRGYGDLRGDNVPTFLHPGGKTSRAPAWNTNAVRLTARRALREYRDRARMVQAVDRMIGRLRSHLGPNTYLFLTSDNGYHLGQLRLNGGKGTPYDFDTHVPMVVVGPGVRPGPRRQFVSLLDLAPTFERLAGIDPPGTVSGVSFAPSLHHPAARGSRYVFYEHTFGLSRPGEVDSDRALGGDLSQIPSYIGVRGPQGLLVRFDLDDTWTGHRYAWELYSYRSGFERTNVFARDHDQPWARLLMHRLLAWDGCAPATCRAARG